MSSPSISPLESWLLDCLRQAEEPLSVDQILERLPASVGVEVPEARRKLKNLLKRPEVGRAARGRYIYLPSRITGSTLRLPITGREMEDGPLAFGPELAFALWFSELQEPYITPKTAARCELPDGTHSRFTVEQMVRDRRHSFAWLPFVTAGPELRNWLREQEAAAGDSLLVQITDADRSRCRVWLERRSERDNKQILRRDQELAEAAARVLRDSVRGSPLAPTDLAGWLLGGELYRVDCPPDPLLVVLHGDRHFTEDRHGHFAMATKWEWIRYREAEATEELIRELFGSSQSSEAERVLSEPEERKFLGLDPLEELQPWLDAVGYWREPAAEPDDSALEAEVAARREKVYRLRAALKHRPSVQRVLELSGNNTLVDLDNSLREAFGHDAMDHMGGFFVRTGGGRQRETLATVNPFHELEEGEDLELAELNLEPGDELAYVYDFGDWIEHVVQVEAVLAPQPGATYPRQMGRGTGTARKRAG